MDGLNVNYKLINSNNCGKKDLSKFNPYALSYLISFIMNLVTILFFEIKNNNNETVPKNKILILITISTYLSMIGGSLSTRLVKNRNGYNGMRFIGGYLVIIFICIVSSKYLNIESNELLNLVNFLSGPRIFLTRFSSWLCNDLTGKINPKNLRPYNTAFYESFFEGLLPFIFLFTTSTFINCKLQNLAVCLIYSLSRFIIEFKKNKYLGNKSDELPTDVLTLGQIDTIIYFVFSIWYIFKSNSLIVNLYEFSILFMLFFDVNYRITRNILNKTNNFGIIKFKWSKTFNKGFLGGKMQELNRNKKLLYGILSLLISNFVSLNNLPYLFTFNIAALLNIGERYIYGFVTDYLTIKFLKLKTYNLNFADMVITCSIIYSVTLRVLTLF